MSIVLDGSEELDQAFPLRPDSIADSHLVRCSRRQQADRSEAIDRQTHTQLEKHVIARICCE